MLTEEQLKKITIQLTNPYPGKIILLPDGIDWTAFQGIIFLPAEDWLKPDA